MVLMSSSVGISMIPSAASGATAIEVAVAIAVAITEPSPPSSVTKEKSKSSSSSYSSNIDLPFVKENSLTVRFGTYNGSLLVILIVHDVMFRTIFLYPLPVQIQVWQLTFLFIFI